MSWPMVTIERIASVKGGKRLPKGHDFSDSPTDHPYIRARDIGGNRIAISAPVYVSEQTFPLIQRYTVKAGDVVITIVGANVGDIGFVRDDLEGANLTENAACIRVKGCACDARFLGFQLSAARSKERFQLLAGGAAQGKLGLYKINSFEITLPPLAQQNRIASTLSAYDDLIENNRRRIQLLEQAARLLYKEWFVHLRFPDHEHTKMVDGVPEGWEKKTLSEMAEITMGQSPKSVYYNEDGNGLPFHQGVTNFGVRFPSHKTYCTVRKRIAQAGDILFSVRAPVGRINITRDEIVIGRGLSAIRSNCGQQNLLFYALKDHFFKEDMIGGGAIFAAITKKDLHGIELVQPADRIAKMFMEYVVPIDLQIANLHQTTERLAKARDLLLPRLMNGEVEV